MTDENMSTQNGERAESGGKTLVFALGSAHGDDQLGWLVAERLAETLADDRVLIRAASSPDRLLDFLDGVVRLIVCDACQNIGARGDIHIWRWPDAPLRMLHGSSSHDLDLATVLALAEQLHRLPRNVMIVGVEGDDDRPGRPFLAVFEEAVSRAAETIVALIHAEGQKPGTPSSNV